MSKSSEAVIAWRVRIKQRMIEALGGQCVVCGYDRWSGNLHCHHLDPTAKEVTFSGARTNPRAWTRIVDELRKCVLVCDRCHTEIHAGLAEVPADAARFDEAYASPQRGARKTGQ